MHLRKKVFLSSLFSLTLLLMSCQSDFSHRIDLGYTGGASVKVNVKTDSMGFQTKSSDGILPKTSADVDHIVLVLSTNSTDPYNNPVNGTAFLSFPNTGGSATYDNLKPSTTYYLAAKAFNDPGETINYTENGVTIATETLVVDAAGVPSISNDTGIIGDWDINVQIQNGIGASITTNIDVEEGTSGLFELNDFRIDQDPGINAQVEPDIFLNERGLGLVVWADQRNNNNIFARRYLNFLPSGNDFPVTANIDPTLVYISPSINMSDNGNGILAWMAELNVVGTDYFHIYARKIDNFNFGVNPVIRLDSQLDTNNQYNPDVSMSPDGEFGLVVWNSLADGAENIYALAFTSADNFASYQISGADLNVNVNTANSQFKPAVSRIGGATGRAMITWGSTHNAGLSQIYARSLVITNNAPAQPTVSFGDPEILVSQTGLDFQDDPDIYLNNQGDGLIIWQSTAGATSDIQGRRVNAYSVNGPIINITSNLTGDEYEPSIYLDQDGNGLVSWTDTRNGNNCIFFRRIVRFTPVGNELRLDDSFGANDQMHSKIFMQSEQKGAAVWHDTRDGDENIYGHRIFSLFPQ